MARDFRGVEIHSGDRLVYVSSGRYTQRGTAVAGVVHRTRVALTEWQGDGSPPDLVNGGTCFVVGELPPRP